MRPLSPWGITSAAIAAAALVGMAAVSRAPHDSDRLQFVFTSDAHYGLTRPSFRGATGVDASVVNAALVASINALPTTTFPDDEGLDAGRVVGGLDFVAQGGDVANREERRDDGTSIQPASVSWRQFAQGYLEGVRTEDRSGHRTPVFVIPGNHDLSNAFGFYRPMTPPLDPGSYLAIDRLMRGPLPAPDAEGHDVPERFFRSMDLGGVHLQFIHLWPDSVMRARMAGDLAGVDPSVPVLVFAHDQPDVEAKHFVNPNGAHDLNTTDQFENLLSDVFVDGPGIDAPSVAEQSQLEAFLVAHPNVTAYFHGNSNWHQVYDWNGPGRQARVHVVRADSPMKGAVSAVDETRLSFEVVTIDRARGLMTVRECLWNAAGAGTGTLTWGETTTVRLAPRRTT